jgi:hypothetical protein
MIEVGRAGGRQNEQFHHRLYRRHRRCGCRCRFPEFHSGACGRCFRDHIGSKLSFESPIKIAQRSSVRAASIELPGAARESIDRGPRDLRFIEQSRHDVLKKRRAQLQCAFVFESRRIGASRDERPTLLESFEWRIAAIDDDALRAVEDGVRDKSGIEPLEPHDLLDIGHIAGAMEYSHGDKPREKFGIFLDIGNEIEHLLTGVGKLAPFAMARHLPPSSAEFIGFRKP